jgi:hypothetical protein
VSSQRDRRADRRTSDAPDRTYAEATARAALAQLEYHYSTGETILREVVSQLGVLPTEYIRQIVTETLAAAAGYAEDRAGRPDRTW